MKLKYFNDLQKDYKVFNKTFIKRVLNLGIPMGLSAIIVSLMTILDQVFIGQSSSIDGNIGNYAIGATLIATWYYNLIIMFIMGISSTITIYAAQNFGAKKFKKLAESIKLNFYISMFIAILAIIFAWVFPNEIAKILASTNKGSKAIIAQANAKYAPEYLSIISLTLIAYVFSNTFTRFYAWNEKTRIILYITLIA